MKNHLTFLLLFMLIGAIGTIAQAPQSFKYQAVARDNNGAPLVDQNVSIRISIIKDTPNGDIIYTETHAVQTNEFGLMNIEIGTGIVNKGEFAEIEWGIDEYFLRLMMDVSGGDSFQWMGTAQLLSVPYALFAGNGVQFDPNLECNEDTEGSLRYNPDTKVFEFCDGTAWVELGSGTSPFNCGDPLVDVRDGRTYATVQIGTQCWMAENLNYGTYTESVFTNMQHSDVSNNGTVQKYAYDNDENNLTAYGGLYDWNEMMNYTNTEAGQGICPDGWHVPSRDEFDDLIDVVGGLQTAGTALMIGGSSGFEFPLGGSRTAKGGFSVGGTAGIWSSTVSVSHPTSNAWSIYFTENASNISRSTDVMFVGKACRCLKD